MKVDNNVCVKYRWFEIIARIFLKFLPIPALHAPGSYLMQYVYCVCIIIDSNIIVVIENIYPCNLHLFLFRFAFSTFRVHVFSPLYCLYTDLIISYHLPTKIFSNSSFFLVNLKLRAEGLNI